MSNLSTEYTINSTDSFSGLMQQSQTWSGGALGPLLLFTIFSVTYFSLRGARGGAAFQASAWVTWLSSVFLTLTGVLDSSISLFLLIIVVVTTLLQVKGRR